MFNKKMAMIGMIMFILCGIISCDDDEFATRLEIGEDLLAEGIEAEIDGKIATLNISSNDNWTIDVPKDASHWVYLPVNSGQGDQNVLVNIDANFGSSAGRSTTLTITAGDIVKKVTVTQVPTFNGQTVSNDDETADYIKIAATKGVGMGLNLGRLTTKNSVINLKALDKLQQLNNAEYSAYFTYNKQAKASAQGAVRDSVDTKKDSLGVALSFDINYGNFKLNIGGAYHGDESKNHYKTEYRYGATYNIATASADVPSLTALYNDASASKDPADNEQLLKRSLLTPGFIDAKKTVEDAYAENDEDDFNDAVEDLVGKYGPVVISGCDLGGSVSLWMKYNRDSIAEIMHVDTAHVNAALNVGLLKMQGKIEVSYKKEGIQIFESSAFKYNIAGGAKVAQDNVSSVLSVKRKKGDNDKVYNDLHDKMDAWIASLDANNPATLSYTRLKIYPIWYFFQGKVRNAVKRWIKTNYEDKMDIINNNVVDADVPDR